MRAPIERLLEAKSIAIVGTSPGSGRGARVHRNLQRFGYVGDVYGINPKYTDVFGSACYPSVLELPQPVDCAVVAVPAASSVTVVEQCAERGIPSAILLASGFAESGPDGRVLQERIAAVATAARMAVCGPNCLGIVNVATRMVAYTGVLPVHLRPGGVALVSQSGGLTAETSTALMQRGVGFSHVVSCGNSAALTFEQLLEYFVDRPDVSVLAVIAESIRQPDLLGAVARRAAAAGKPIVLLKLGRSADGQKAIASHTGALAGDDAVLDAVLEAWGVIGVSSDQELIETVTLLSGARLPSSRDVAFVIPSGGRSALTADLAVRHGVQLAAYTPATLARLETIQPAFAATGNPLDIAAPVYENEDRYQELLSTLVDDPRVALLAVYGLMGDPSASVASGDTPHPVRLAKRAAAAAALTDKPVIAFTAISTGPIYDQVLGVLNAGGVPLLHGTQDMLRAIEHTIGWAEFRQRPPDMPAPAWNGPPASQIDPIVARLKLHGGLSEFWSKKLLQTYGVPTTREGLAGSEEEAQALAAEIGYPVAAKAASVQLAHKTEAGLVVLNIRDRDQLRTAFRELWSRAEAELGPRSSTLEGILIQEMVPVGVEVIVGTRLSDFGPAVVFGAGGIFTELLQDTRIGLAPLTQAEALGLIAATRIGRVLAGVRGQAALDVSALADLIVRVSHLASDVHEVVGSIDLNPVIVVHDRVVAVDALVTGRGDPLRGPAV